jgi:hypothetical protein
MSTSKTADEEYESGNATPLTFISCPKFTVAALKSRDRILHDQMSHNNLSPFVFAVLRQRKTPSCSERVGLGRIAAQSAPSPRQLEAGADGRRQSVMSWKVLRKMVGEHGR